MAGREQRAPRGESEDLTELAKLLCQVTNGLTVRALGERYHQLGGKSTWAKYRSGGQAVPRHVLLRVIDDLVPDERTRLVLAARVEDLWQRIEHPPGQAAAGPGAAPAATTGADGPPAPGEGPTAASRPDGPEPPRSAGVRPSDTGRLRRPRLILGAGAAVLALAATGVLLSHGVGSVGHADRPAEAAAAPPQAPAPTPQGTAGGAAAEHVYAVTADHGAVLRWDGGTAWTTVGGRADRLFTGQGLLFATDPDTHAVFRYDGVPGSWTNVGTPGADFAVGRGALYSLAPDSSMVLAWNEVPGSSWARIGGPAARLYAHGGDLFATGPAGKEDLFHYTDADGSWHHLSGPAAAFAVDGRHVYRLAPDRSGIWQWDGTVESWTRIGGPAADLYAGGVGLFATDPATGRISRYDGTPGSWTAIGEAGSDLVVGDHFLYRIAPDHGSVWQGDRDGHWTRIGGPASTVAVDR
ncbi:hypothetical protein [Kitasatospora sp. NPDC059827]|uniref:hypothetical protein n=1 Tax=Kitasatospora sp. NPDC059827 TaxID=3346964 RepID=UPI0036597FCA